MLLPEKYNHLLFDLDHTLWDFDTNSRETLSELFYEFELDRRLGVKLDQVLEVYHSINGRLWGQYNRGEIDKATLRVVRFNKMLEHFHHEDKELARILDTEYIHRCPIKGALMTGAIELLEHVSKNFELHILTNGFNETQARKLASSGIQGYFKSVTTSENAGMTKPDKRFFKYALSQFNGTPDECLMIGDNLFTDISGARSAKIDQCYYNPRRKVHMEKVTWEVNTLDELRELL